MVAKELVMAINLRFDTEGVDWVEAATIFEKAPLGTREPEQLKRTFLGSQLVCFAWDEDTLIGIARALSDGELHSVIYDLCILPEYQGAKIGKRIMKAMMERLNTPNIVLWSVPGKEGFYAKLGFNSMLTAMARFENPESSAEKGYIRIK